MRAAMAEAEVGDDVFGEDPTVNRLQDRIATLLGKEAALYVPSGTMGNQLCIKVHTRPGDEVIAEHGSHVFNYETAGAAFLSGVQIHPVKGARGVMAPEDILKSIRPSTYYMPRSRLLCLENTHNRAGGTILSLEQMRTLRSLASEHGLAVHLDGARLWNACAALNVPPAAFATEADSVSVCLSKGLGAPVGSVLAGTHEFVEEARHYRKIFGGGMRQAGVLAAAGLYALDHHLPHLAEDHQKARVLAERLETVDGLDIDMASVQSNIVIISVARTGTSPGEILSQLKAHRVLLSQGNYLGIRAVTHRDVSMEEVQDAARLISQCLRGFRSTGST